jgi:hypothetical protein
MSERRIVFTSFDEDAKGNNPTKIWSRCEDSVRAWCDRIDAELINLPKPEGYQPQWVIFNAFEQAIAFKARCLWMDCDIHVQAHAPNPWEELPDKLWFCQPDPGGRIHPRMRRQYQRYGAHNPRPYVVSALVMFSPKHVRKMLAWFNRELLKHDTEAQRFGRMDGDQELLTVALQETETFSAYFPTHYHKMSKFVRADTPFMHGAGRRKGRKIERFKLMERNRLEAEAKGHSDS